MAMNEPTIHRVNTGVRNLDALPQVAERPRTIREILGESEKGEVKSEKAMTAGGWLMLLGLAGAAIWLAPDLWQGAKALLRYFGDFSWRVW